MRLIRGKRNDVPAGGPLFAVFRLFSEGFSEGWAPDDGLPVFALWQAFNDRYSGSNGYNDLEVLPSLRARGLYERSDSGVIGMLMRGGWKRTRAGDQLQVKLQNLLSEAQQNFTNWVCKEPEKAFDFFEYSGAAMLLSPSLYSEVARLTNVRIEQTKPTPGGFDPEIFELLSVVSRVLDGSVRHHSDSWGSGGTGFGVFGGTGFDGSYGVDSGGDVGGH